MMTVYLICFLAGGLLVALSILGAGDVDADVAGELDLGEAGEAGDGVAGTARFLRVRGLIFGTAFFGLTGTLFTLLRVGPLLTLAFAVAWAIVAGASIQKLMGYLGRNESGNVSSGRLEGSVGKVIVQIDEDRCGKIAIRTSDRTLQLIARLHAEAQARQFSAGDEVVVAEVHDGMAYVVGPTFFS